MSPFSVFRRVAYSVVHGASCNPVKMRSLTARLGNTVPQLGEESHLILRPMVSWRRVAIMLSGLLRETCSFGTPVLEESPTKTPPPFHLHSHSFFIDTIERTHNRNRHYRQHTEVKHYVFGDGWNEGDPDCKTV